MQKGKEVGTIEVCLVLKRYERRRVDVTVEPAVMYCPSTVHKGHCLTIENDDVTSICHFCDGGLSLQTVNTPMTIDCTFK